MSIILIILGSLLVPHQQSLVIEPGRTDYLLAYGGVVQGSAVIPGLQVEWELSGDTFRLKNFPPDSMVVTITYMTLEPLKSIYTNQPGLEPAPGETMGRPASQPDERLDVHGAKTFSLSVNDQGRSELDQGLVVDVSGDLGGVDVAAHIADEEGSFTPEGTTERIEEFDRIFIGLSGESWSVGLGDLDLSHPLPGYGTLDRRLTGAAGKLKLGPVELLGAFGIEGTRRGHIVLDPGDGSRGPYQIGDRSAEQPLIPGSEKVWLDGSLLMRGSENDYVIDYSAGELTFTNRTSIDATSRIEVDYTYAGSDYTSDNELAGLKVGGFELNFYREADSRTHLYHSWSAGQRQILDTTTANQAILPGARYVGDGNGSYLHQEGHYVWVGFDAGDYDVSFRLVGDSAGDYVLDADSGFFRYVPDSSGDYRAEIETSLPNRGEAMVLGFEDEFGDFTVDAAVLGSRNTPNLYNNTGYAWGHDHRVNAGYAGDWLEIGIKHRFRNPDAWIAASGFDVDAADRWGVDSISSGFNEQEVDVSFRPLDSLVIGLEAGHLGRRSEEWRAAGYSYAPSYDTRFEWLQDRQRARAGLHPRVWIFTPQVGMKWEHNQDSADTRYFEPSAGLKARPTDELELAISASRRIDQTYEEGEEGWQDTLYYDRAAFTGNWDGEKLTSSLTAGIERYLPQGVTGVAGCSTVASDGLGCSTVASDGLGVTGDGGWLAFYGDVRTYYTPSSRIRISAEASQHLARTQSVVVTYIPVEPGTGDYTRDAETGEYIPAGEEGGDYERTERVEPGEAFELDRNASLGLNLAFKPFRAWGSFSFRDAGELSSISASSRLTILPGDDPLTVILYPSYINQSYPSWGGLTEHLTRWEAGGELRSRLHPSYLLRLEGEYTDEDKSRGGLDLRTCTQWEGVLSPILRLWLTAEPQLGFGYLYATEPLYYPDLGEVVIRKMWAGTNLEKRVFEWWITVGGQVTSRVGNIDAGDLPYLIGKDDPLGIHSMWTLGVERSFRLGELGGNRLSLRFRYEGNFYPDQRGLTNDFEFSAGMYF